jgi:hypothetical protein
MKNLRNLLLASLVALPLIACGGASQTDSAAEGNDSMLGQKIRQATDTARKELASNNISISRNGSPLAEITPSGDLLIEGKAVTVDAAQRQLLLDYRQQLSKIAEAGIDVGVQGANLGVRAAGEALKGVLSGNTDEIEAKVNAEAEKIKAEARKICDLLPALQAQQQLLAQSLPAFAPYASIEQHASDQCLQDIETSAP